MRHADVARGVFTAARQCNRVVIVQVAGPDWLAAQPALESITRPDGLEVDLMRDGYYVGVNTPADKAARVAAIRAALAPYGDD